MRFRRRTFQIHPCRTCKQPCSYHTHVEKLRRLQISQMHLVECLISSTSRQWTALLICIPCAWDWCVFCFCHFCHGLFTFSSIHSFHLNAFNGPWFTSIQGLRFRSRFFIFTIYPVFIVYCLEPWLRQIKQVGNVLSHLMNEKNVVLMAKRLDVVLPPVESFDQPDSVTCDEEFGTILQVLKKMVECSCDVNEGGLNFIIQIHSFFNPGPGPWLSMFRFPVRIKKDASCCVWETCGNEF